MKGSTTKSGGRHLALFSRSGFTAEVLAEQSPDLALFTLEDLLPDSETSNTEAHS